MVSRRRWGIVAAVIVGLVGAAGLAAAAFDPNAYKPRLVQALSEAAGRPVAVNGPVRIGWSLQPSVEVTDVTLANLAGGSRPDIVHVEVIRAELSIAALFRRELEVTRLTLIGPNILFEEVGGKPNWLIQAPPAVAGRQGPPAAGESQAPRLLIRAVHIQNGMITARFPARTRVIGVRSLDLAQPVEGGPVDLTAVLVYSDFKPFDLHVSARPTGGLRDPWTIAAKASAFDTTAAATGTLDLDGPFDLQVDASSGALEKLNAILPEMRLPPLHGVTLSAHVKNGPSLGALPVFGATTLRVERADLGAIVPGLVLGTTGVTLPAAGGVATVSAAGRFAGQAFSVAGTVGVPTRLDGRSSIPVDLKAQATAGPKDAAGGQGSLALKGAVAVDTLHFAGLDGVVGLRAPALAPLRPLVSQGLPALTDVRLDGRVVVPADRGSVAFKSARLTSHEGDVAGDFTLGLRDTLAISGTLASPRMDLDAMIAAFGVALPPAPALAGAAGPAISTVALPWALLRGPMIDLSAKVDALSFQGEVWKGVGFALTLKGGKLVAGPASLSLPSGQLRVSLTVDAASEAVPIGLSLQAPGIPLSLVARYAGLPGPMQGAVAIDAQLRAAGHSPHEIAASLTGPVSATLVDGRMTNAAFSLLTAASLDALGIKVPPQGETALRCMGLVGTFAKGVGLFKTIALDTTWLQLDGGGKVDFGNETVALKLRPMAQVSGSSVAVPVVVEGPFHAVRGRLDADGLDKLGLFIDGLFGGDHSTACADAGLGPKPAKPG